MKTRSLFAVTTATLLTPGVLGLDIPSNVRSFYDQVRSKGYCTRKLATGFHNSQDDHGDMSYCGDHLVDSGVVYIQGPGRLSNMDVDCDGTNAGFHNDGRCNGAGTTVSTTAVRDIIESYDVGITDLSSYIHPFVVFGNTGDKPGWKTFDPREFGVEKTSVMAVVCGDQMFYGIWGDTNGDGGDKAHVGEASLSLATACFGHGMSGRAEDDSSHDEEDVLYIAFTGEDAVPGPRGAYWDAEDFDAFHRSIVGLGNSLISRLGRTDNSNGNKTASAASTTTTTTTTATTTTTITMTTAATTTGAHHLHAPSSGSEEP
ncbi:glycoside hydrolase family 75 protein, partial [Geosmithia morbida]